MPLQARTSPPPTHARAPQTHNRYVCRTLSFAGAEFETVEAALEAPMAAQYEAAAALWSELFRRGGGGGGRVCMCGVVVLCV